MKNILSIRKIFFLLFVFLNFLHAKENPKILILNSYHPTFLSTSKLNNGIFSVFNDPTKYDFHIEYMDSKRYHSDKHYENLKNVYKEKYKDIKFDVILSADDNAFNFLKKYNKEIFKDTPVVFSGTNNLQKSSVVGYDNFTGVNEQSDIKTNFDLILKIHPKTKNIYTLVDTTPTGKSIKKELLKTIDIYENKNLKFHIIDNVTIDELISKIKKLPKDSVILVAVFSKTRDNRFLDYYEADQILSRNTDIPLYSMHDSKIGYGSVGGYLVNAYSQGRESAKMAKRVLDGEDIKNIPILYKSPNLYMFDYKQLEKFNINIENLPENSKIINKPFSFYDKYKILVNGTIFFITLLLILLIVLLLNIKKRKLTEKHLKKSQKKLEILNTNLDNKVRDRTEELEHSNDELEQTIENLKITQKRLVEAEKMSSLGVLVAGIAHEMNTPIGIGLTGATHFLEITDQIKKDYDEENMSQEEFEHYISTSKEIATLLNTNLDRTAKLVKSFKQISFDQSSEDKRKINLKDYIDEVTFSMNNIIKKTNINIENNCDTKININTYPGAISQIITNLIINSFRHAFGEKEIGNIYINASMQEGIIKLVYKDDGKGIKEEVLPKIFDPFFTTNREEGGTGLGLHILYNIISSSLNGTIKCKSEESNGVEFIILFQENIDTPNSENDILWQI